MANGETDVQALARVLTHAVSIVNRLTEESDRMMELLRQAEAQQGTREAHLARTEQAAQAALKTAQTSAEEITSRQQVLEKAVDGLPDRLSRGIKDKAHEISRAATQVISVSAEAATSMQAERKQLRRWAASSLWIRALTWLGAGMMPMLMLLLALTISYDIKLIGGRNMIGIEMHDPPPRDRLPRIGPRR